MKSNKKILTFLMVAVLTLLVSIFCMSAAAESADNAKATSSEASSLPLVSGCDLKKEDLTMVNIKIAGLKMLIPTGKDNGKGELITIESDPEDIKNSQFAKAGYSRSTLIDGNIFLYFNTDSDNYCQVYAGLVPLNPLDAYYGDYSQLTDGMKDEILSQEVSADSPGITGSFEKINGRTYLLISNNSSDSTGSKEVSYALYTIIGKYKYIIQIVAVNPNAEDLKVVNEVLNSVKLGGLSEPVSTLEIALIVCVVVLLIAVAFAVFMLYRLGQYVKTETVPASVFGFDVPDAAPVEDDDDDTEADIDEDDVESEEPSDALPSKVSLKKDESIL